MNARKNGIIFCIVCILSLALMGCGSSSGTAEGNRQESDSAQVQEVDKDSAAEKSNPAADKKEQSAEEQTAEKEDAAQKDDTEITIMQGAEDESVSVQVLDDQKRIINKYQTLLQNSTNLADVYDYIEKNMDDTTPETADALVTGLFGCYDDIKLVSYDTIAKDTAYMTSGMASFVNLMHEEADAPVVVDGKINISLEKLLERCSGFERQMTQYPESATCKRAFEQYSDLLTLAITGGYDGKQMESNYYLSTSSEHVIDGNAIAVYQQYVTDHQDEKTSLILQEYLTVLTENKNQMKKPVIQFYDELQKLIYSEFPIE